MTCRAPTSSSTCSGSSPTGQPMTYDAERRLSEWASGPGSSPTASEQYAYDGEGNRVWQQATSVNGSTTTTTDIAYELGTDETTTTTITGQQPTTTNTRSYPLPGGATAERDSTGLYYLATDQLGTPIAALRLDDGVLVGTQLRTPYGQARYSSASSSNGGMHSSFGFTGQREDTQAAGSSGLTYFNARYYDPLVGRFTSADDHIGADPLLDNYAYVGGRVEGTTDPSGNDACDADCIQIVMNIIIWLASLNAPPAVATAIWMAVHTTPEKPAITASERTPMLTETIQRLLTNQGGGNEDNGTAGPPKGVSNDPLDNIRNGSNNAGPYYQKDVSRGAKNQADKQAVNGRQQIPGKINMPAIRARIVAGLAGADANQQGHAAPATSASGDPNVPIISIQVAPGITITVNLPASAVQTIGESVQLGTSWVSDWASNIGTSWDNFIQNITPKSSPNPCMAGIACGGDPLNGGDDEGDPELPIDPGWLLRILRGL